MEDPLKAAQRALYTRISDQTISSLFTRPAVLALAEETGGIIPIKALNQDCRGLLNAEIVNNNEVSEMVNRIAAESGFTDMDQFTSLFQAATGWQPVEWYRCFCRDNMP